MMTIKQFASLCGCTTQTLRYYDKIDLLKPIKVDQWTGYRYYGKGQAVDFVKIKNFQAAEFSIDEIKSLLHLTDQQICDAFDRKIEQQRQKLERIREIKQSYLNEKNTMEKLVQSLSDYLLHAISDYQVLQEFGLSPQDGAEIVSRLEEYIKRVTLQRLPAEPDVQLIMEGKTFRGAEQVAEVLSTLKDKGYEETVFLGDESEMADADFTDENSEIIWHCEGWNYVREFFGDIPHLESGKEYCFCFRLADGTNSDGFEFPLFMIAAMLVRDNCDDVIMGCSVKNSEDGKNHFVLRKKV